MAAVENIERFLNDFKTVIECSKEIKSYKLINDKIAHDNVMLSEALSDVKTELETSRTEIDVLKRANLELDAGANEKLHVLGKQLFHLKSTLQEIHDNIDLNCGLQELLKMISDTKSAIGKLIQDEIAQRTDLPTSQSVSSSSDDVLIPQSIADYVTVRGTIGSSFEEYCRTYGNKEVFDAIIELHKTASAQVFFAGPSITDAVVGIKPSGLKMNVVILTHLAVSVRDILDRFNFTQIGSKYFKGKTIFDLRHLVLRSDSSQQEIRELYMGLIAKRTDGYCCYDGKTFSIVDYEKFLRDVKGTYPGIKIRELIAARHNDVMRVPYLVPHFAEVLAVDDEGEISMPAYIRFCDNIRNGGYDTNIIEYVAKIPGTRFVGSNVSTAYYNKRGENRILAIATCNFEELQKYLTTLGMSSVGKEWSGGTHKCIGFGLGGNTKINVRYPAV